MRDDGIGVRVVKAIENDLQKHAIASFVGETDFQCCLDAINPDDLVIIVDAMSQEKEPGSMDITLLSDALKKRGKLRTQHEFSLFDLIDLHGPKTQGYFVGIEVAEIGFGFELSKSLRDHFEQICADVLNTVLNIKKEAEYV